MSRSRRRPGKPRPSTRSGRGGRPHTTGALTRNRIATIGKTLAWTGGILFVVGNIGARTGWVIFPFDRHHVFSQFGGMVVLLVGVALAGRRRPPG